MDPVTLSLLGTLVGYAPELVKWLTGSDKAEKVAGVAVEIAKKVTGTATGEEAVVALGNDPQLIHEYRKQVLQNEVEFDKALLADRQDARKMQIAALQQDDLFSKRFVYYFITAWSLFSMLFLLFVTFADIPEKNIRFVDTTLGFLLGTAVASMFAYLLGSTFRSQKKDDTIQQLITK